jgi:hypothetical protein
MCGMPLSFDDDFSPSNMTMTLFFFQLFLAQCRRRRCDWRCYRVWWKGDLGGHILHIRPSAQIQFELTGLQMEFPEMRSRFDELDDLKQVLIRQFLVTH